MATRTVPLTFVEHAVAAGRPDLAVMFARRVKPTQHLLLTLAARGDSDDGVWDRLAASLVGKLDVDAREVIAGRTFGPALCTALLADRSKRVRAKLAGNGSLPAGVLAGLCARKLPKTLQWVRAAGNLPVDARLAVLTGKTGPVEFVESARLAGMHAELSERWLTGAQLLRLLGLKISDSTVASAIHPELTDPDAAAVAARTVGQVRGDQPAWSEARGPLADAYLHTGASPRSGSYGRFTLPAGLHDRADVILGDRDLPDSWRLRAVEHASADAVVAYVDEIEASGDDVRVATLADAVKQVHSGMAVDDRVAGRILTVCGIGASFASHADQLSSGLRVRVGRAAISPMASMLSNATKARRPLPAWFDAFVEDRDWVDSVAIGDLARYPALWDHIARRWPHIARRVPLTGGRAGETRRIHDGLLDELANLPAGAADVLDELLDDWDGDTGDLFDVAARLA